MPQAILPLFSQDMTIINNRFAVQQMGDKEVNGFDLQFNEICENSRCSILFHLLVPGGKWLT